MKKLTKAERARLELEERDRCGAFARWAATEAQRTGRAANSDKPEAKMLLARIRETRAALYGDCLECGGSIDEVAGVCTAKCYRDSHGGKSWQIGATE